MNNYSHPLVSVVTPNFNGKRFLRRAITSVSLQNFSAEHIIVDDCSTDGSWELLVELANQYKWIKPIKLEKNSGPVLARNKAIESAKGRFIAFLDVDDFWLPNKLDTQVQFMLNNNCALSFSDYRFVSETGDKIGRRLRGFHRIGWTLHHTTRYLGCLTVVIDRDKLPHFKFPNIDPALRAEDFLAWSNCIKITGPALRCPFDLARYSVVPLSRSSNSRRAALSVWRLYRHVEKIPLITAFLYFFIYLLSAALKRWWLRPIFDRHIIDRNFEWSSL